MVAAADQLLHRGGDVPGWGAQKSNRRSAQHAPPPTLLCFTVMCTIRSGYRRMQWSDHASPPFDGERDTAPTRSTLLLALDVPRLDDQPFLVPTRNDKHSPSPFTVSVGERRNHLPEGVPGVPIGPILPVVPTGPCGPVSQLRRPFSAAQVGPIRPICDAHPRSLVGQRQTGLIIPYGSCAPRSPFAPSRHCGPTGLPWSITSLDLRRQEGTPLPRRRHGGSIYVNTQDGGGKWTGT